MREGGFSVLCYSKLQKHVATTFDLAIMKCNIMYNVLQHDVRVKRELLFFALILVLIGWFEGCIL